MSTKLILPFRKANQLQHANKLHTSKFVILFQLTQAKTFSLIYHSCKAWVLYFYLLRWFSWTGCYPMPFSSAAFWLGEQGIPLSSGSEENSPMSSFAVVLMWGRWQSLLHSISLWGYKENWLNKDKENLILETLYFFLHPWCPELVQSREVHQGERILGQFCTEVWEALVYAFIFCDMATYMTLRLHGVLQTELTVKCNPQISHRMGYY